MPTITVAPFNIRIVAETGETIFQALKRHKIPIATSCSGDGVCAKCVIRILDGIQNVSPFTEIEEKFRKENRLDKDSRLACQTHAHDDVEITTTYW